MLTELQRQREAHKAVRARLWSTPKPEPKVVPIQNHDEPKSVSVYRVTANVPLGNVVHFTGLVVRPHIVHKRRPYLDDIINVVADFYRLSVRDIKSVHRDTVTVRARHMVIHLAREMTPLSLPFIGRKLGGKDHTTILHGARRMKSLVRDDPRTADEVAILKLKISDLLGKWGKTDAE